ncbi:hypothetical protein pdam_00018567 [Pocillopora damicornis]|uniref:Strawberry notch AAA domain-containing protein n=1 Tax=Pocillopora damicornis TaxID=46731 RepID=A0A3M6UWY2_POCDA|nr:hypothetical protein pdam_00018567 [Pocillopora damicornis]
MSGENDQDLFGTDLLSEALGQSGLNLDDLLGNPPGSFLPQSLFDFGDVRPDDFDFLDNFNLNGDFIPEAPYPTLTSSNNSRVTSNNVNTQRNVQVSQVQQTFLGPQPTFPNVASSGTVFPTPRQLPPRCQTPQSVSKPSINSNVPRLQSSTSPILLDLLNSGSNNSVSSNSMSNISDAAKKELTKKDVSRLWSNHDVSLNHVGEDNDTVSDENEDEEDEEEELGQTDTYAEYVPIRLGRRHPDPVVETSSLSSVTPPDIWYRLMFPKEVIDNCYLSALQLEAVVYACQQHETFLADGTRAGFLIGDGAGVGKGRTVAGVIYENYLLGRKRAIWDLKDLGCHINVHPLNKFKYDAKISSKRNGSFKKGVIFSTYSSLIGESQGSGKYNTRMGQLLQWCGSDFDGVIVLDECHKAKNLVPTGSSKPTKTGLAVLGLQSKLPKARVIYCSATGASEPKNMAYMSRLGIWGPGTPFREFNDFIQAVERRGVGAMEIVAMEMKLRGMYMTRQLSFAGVTFDIKELPLAKDFIEMYDASVKLWREAREKFEKAADLMEADSRVKKTIWGQFWSAHQCVIVGLQSTGEARTLEQLEESGGELNDFVSTAKGVLQALIEKHFPAADRKKFADLFGIDNDANDKLYDQSSSLASGQLTPRKRKQKVSSGSDSESDESQKSNGENELFNVHKNNGRNDGAAESCNSSAAEEEDDSNPFGVSGSDDEDPWLHRKSRKSSKNKSQTGSPDSSYNALAAAGLKVGGLPWSTPGQRTKQPNGLESQHSWNPAANSPGPLANSAADMCRAMKRELLDKLDVLSKCLPPNTLDELIDELGGPDNVAEMTGRKGRVVSNEDGTVSYQSRSKQDVPLEIINVVEKNRFMDGQKSIAIISEAASSGISLQADRRAKNQRRRVHITLELPWSADKAIQQFAKRLESLGALTHGDRRATESQDLSRYNIDNKYGRAALEAVLKAVTGQSAPTIPPPQDYKGEFFQDVRTALIGVGLVVKDDKNNVTILDKDFTNISRFLNRILGVEVELQNHLFAYFMKTLSVVVQQAKRSGRWDEGILDLGAHGEAVTNLSVQTFAGNSTMGTATTELHTISVERGMSWEDSFELRRSQSHPEDGYYLSNQVRNHKKTAILVMCQSRSKKKDVINVYRPNTGLQTKQDTLEDVKKKYKKVLDHEAQSSWVDQYESALSQCNHAYWKGNCKRMTLGLSCEVGRRQRTFHILSGSVLSVWSKVESVLAGQSGANSKIQIVRCRKSDGSRIVGCLIPSNCVPALTRALTPDTQQEPILIM